MRIRHPKRIFVEERRTAHRWFERAKTARPIFRRVVVRPRRFELLTYSFGGCRSIQLSYGRITLA